MKQTKFAGVVLALFICILLISCSTETSEEMIEPKEEETTDPKKKETTESKEPEVVHKEITVTAIGDMLIHDSVYEDAKTANGYKFMPMLAQVKPFLNDSTITIANQETMIGGIALGLSSYPTFNSPYAVGDALKKAGVDVVTIANNHALDGGEEAIRSAIRHWEKIDMMYVGAYKSENDSNRIRVYKTDEGISAAILAFTYGTNGIPIPEGKDYLVNLIDKALMADKINRAKKKADIVILNMHFGDQYERLPNERQKSLVQFAADHGVDVVIGHHPHVLQPINWVKGEDGNKTLVAYSLGNFLSGQDEFYRRIGGIFKFTVHKTVKAEKETVQVKAPKFMPTFVNYQNGANYEVVPMYQLTNDDLRNAQQHYQKIKNHMSQWLPGLEFIEK